MADNNVTPYVKLNEVVDDLNSMRRYLAEIDSLFRAIAEDNSLTGWAARRIFRKYVRNSRPPSTAGMRAVDIPPVIGNSLEIDREDNDRDSGGKRSGGPNHLRGVREISDHPGKQLFSLPRRERVSPPEDRPGVDNG